MPRNIPTPITCFTFLRETAKGVQWRGAAAVVAEESEGGVTEKRVSSEVWGEGEECNYGGGA